MIVAANSLPHNHVCHFISRPELLIIDSNDGDDPRNVLNELLIGRVKISQVVQGYGRLALSLSQINTSLTLLRAHIKVDYQVWLFPVRDRNNHNSLQY